MCRNAYSSRPGPQCRLAGQAYSARHAFPATDNDHMAKVTLVSRSRTRSECTSQQFVVDPPVHRLYAFSIRLRDIKPGEPYFTAVSGRIAQEQTRFQAYKGHRKIRVNSASEYLPGIAINASRDVQRQCGRGMSIERRDRVRKLAADVTLESATQHSVNQQIR